MKNIEITREQVVEFVKNHIGDSLIIASLGNGGAGLNVYNLTDEDAAESKLEDLAAMKYNGVVEPAEDFNDEYMPAKLEEFDACVEFESENGCREQILVWDIQ